MRREAQDSSPCSGVEERALTPVHSFDKKASVSPALPATGAARLVPVGCFPAADVGRELSSNEHGHCRGWLQAWELGGLSRGNV